MFGLAVALLDQRTRHSAKSGRISFADGGAVVVAVSALGGLPAAAAPVLNTSPTANTVVSYFHCGYDKSSTSIL